MTDTADTLMTRERALLRAEFLEAARRQNVRKMDLATAQGRTLDAIAHMYKLRDIHDEIQDLEDSSDLTDDSTIIRGRSRIADALGRDEKTVARWIKDGVLTARKAGPYPNSPLVANARDVLELRRQFGEGEADE